MGKLDKLQKKYMSSNERFADLFNYYLFGGEEVIKPESLKEQSVNELVAVYGKDKANTTKERYRDLLKNCVIRQSDRAVYVLLGLENQDKVHYAMPVRHMLYDAMNYASQCERIADEHRRRKDTKSRAEFLSGLRKEDKLKPVITLTLYWGTDEWDGPRSLHEMLDVKDRELLAGIGDYRLNLVTPKDISDFGLFQSDLSKVLDFVSKADDREEIRNYMQENRAFLDSLDLATFSLLSGYVGGKIKKEEGGAKKMKMAQGFVELLAESKAEGEARREKRAIEQLADYLMKQDKTLKKKQALEMATGILR